MSTRREGGAGALYSRRQAHSAGRFPAFALCEMLWSGSTLTQVNSSTRIFRKIRAAKRLQGEPALPPDNRFKAKMLHAALSGENDVMKRFIRQETANEQDV
jgi:hypothetical protein